MINCDPQNNDNYNINITNDLSICKNKSEYQESS